MAERKKKSTLNPSQYSEPDTAFYSQIESNRTPTFEQTPTYDDSPQYGSAHPRIAPVVAYNPGIQIQSNSSNIQISAAPSPNGSFNDAHHPQLPHYQRIHSNQHSKVSSIQSNDDEKLTSVSAILNDLDRNRALSLASKDTDYVVMQEMIKTQSIGDLVVTSSEIPIDDIMSTDQLKIRSKYKQLKEKYIRLHTNYKKTKNLRTHNETLVNKVKTYEKHMTELQKQVTQQHDTIIRQNKHLLKLSSERDDMEEIVEEQNAERRIIEKYGSPVAQLALSRHNSANKNDNDALSGHVRAITTPSLAFKQQKSNTQQMPLEELDDNDIMFEEDSKFTMTFLRSMDDDDDDDDDDEEKYSTPGGPQSMGDDKKARFVEVDDITRDVERKYYAMSRSVLRSKINPHRVEELWGIIIGSNTDDLSIIEEAAEICDAWSIDECCCGSRLLFILKYYHQWLGHKATMGRRKSRASRNVFNQTPKMSTNDLMEKSGYTASITQFICDKLAYYNDIQLLNDFYHVKRYHISNPSHFNSDDVFKHFVNEFGFCDVKHCTSFRRNHREKSIFGHHNRFRRKVYHLDKKRFRDLDEYDSVTDNRYELHEIHIQQCLDMIHSTLIHDYHNTTMDNLSEFAKQLLKSPLTVTDDDEYSEQQRSASNTPRTTVTNKDHGGSTHFAYKHVIHSTSARTSRVSIIENSPGNMIPLSPQQEDVGSITQDVFSYGFGVRFSYWIREWPDFVQAKHGNLRTELLENDIYRISAFEWDLLQHRAAVFLQSTHGISEYVAQRKGSGNELMKIPVGSRLRINHLIALFTYTNYPNIRISFQKACLRTTPDESFVDVLKRHEQIACWARLLYEAVYLFGIRMESQQKFYHILRSKIMLSKFSANLSCPTTMIANRKIVNNSNIVIQVANAHSRGATYLDISYFSDVPNREERLFFFGDLAFDNIILKGKSHRHYIKSLTLFQKIVQGSYFYHSPLKKKEYQQTIIHFMQNLINSKDYGDVSNYVHMLKDRKKYNDEDIIDGNHIPLYMQHLFDYFCGKIKTIWINNEEFTKLQPNLTKYLAKNNMKTTIYNKESMMGEFTKFLHFEFSANLKYCCTLHWEISGVALRQFKKGEKVFGKEFRVSTIRLYPYIVKNSSKNDGQFRFGIPVKSMPKYLKKIEFRVDLYIKEINYTFSAFSIIDERGTYWYSLFDSSSLRNFETFTLKISFRLINLIVSSSDGNEVNTSAATRHVKMSASMQQPRGSNSIFNLENFRRGSAGKRRSVVQRLSRVGGKLKGHKEEDTGTVVIKM